MWLKKYGICLASARPRVQHPVLNKKKKKREEQKDKHRVQGTREA
jgi:hypothetical protein